MHRRNAEPQFVVCIQNRGYRASLELRKIYRTIPDERAAKRRYLRVIDESGDDYLYPQHCFLPIQLPKSVERALQLAS